MTNGARVGLVLGAGGTTGRAYHLGVLSQLSAATGWDARTAEVIVGTSAGSVAGAYIRGGLSASDLAADVLGQRASLSGQALLERIGPAEPPPAGARAAGLPLPSAPAVAGRALLRPGSIRLGAVAAGLLPLGGVDNGPVVARLRRRYGAAWTTHPFLACAVRLRDGVRVAFGSPGAPSADVPSAVAASCAIPFVWAPVTIGGERYVDGGVHSTTNADLLARDPWQGRLDLVIISAPMSVARGTGTRPDLAGRLLVRRYLAREVAALRRAGTAVVVFQPSRGDLDAMGPRSMDAGRVPAVVAAARAATARRLRAGGAASQALGMLTAETGQYAPTASK
jgi:NTE family protein